MWLTWKHIIEVDVKTINKYQQPCGLLVKAAASYNEIASLTVWLCRQLSVGIIGLPYSLTWVL